MNKDEITRLRLQLAANGYSPIPNRDKACYFKGWPSVEASEENIMAWSRRHSRDATTGLRVENGLAVIDIDINDEALVNGVLNAVLDLCPQLDREDVPFLIRHGRGFKVAVFVRGGEPFTRIHTRTWVPAGRDPEDAPTAMVEIFGGASTRQFGCFGWHTRPEDTEDGQGIEYWWEYASPADTPLAALPVVEKAQFFAIADRAEELLKAAGWEPVARSTSGENDAVRVYDLTEEMVFSCSDGVTRSLDELRKVLATEAGEGLRCSASWLEGPQAKRTDRCLCSLTRGGHVAVHETASGVTHVEAAGEPVDFGPEIDRIGEKLKELDERRRRKIKAVDDLPTAVAKMLDIYAYCPNQQQDVVPLWASSTDEGKQISKFRLEMLRNAAEEVGPRGGRRLINPVDVWLRHERLIVVDGVRMRPDQPRPTFEDNGRRYVNCYDPPLHLSEGGNAQIGVEFLEHLIPDDEERRWFTQWLAFKLRYPHIPGPAVVMVAHKTFGTGRGTLGVLLGKLFGVGYVRNIAFADFTGKTYQSQYNEWQADALLVMVNESSENTDGSTYQTKRNTYEHLKEIVEIRPTIREIKTKGKPNYRALSSTSFIIATNHADALPIPEHDRRFCVLQNGETKPEAWWARLNAWVEQPANVAAFHDYLKAYDLTGYSPYAPPPVFAGKRRMIDDSVSELDEAFDLALQSMPGRAMTRQQIETTVRKMMTVYGMDQAGVNIGQAIKRMTRRDLHRIGTRHGSNWYMREDGVRFALYARTAKEARLLTQEDHDTLVREAKKNGALDGGSSGTLIKIPVRR